MDAANEMMVSLQLPADSLVLLERIADKQGVAKEEIARQAVELWLEKYKKHGPAYSRRQDAAQIAN